MKPARLILCLLLIGCSPSVTLDEFQHEHVPSKPAENCIPLMSCHPSLAYDMLTGWAEFPEGYIPDTIQLYPTSEDLKQGNADRCITLMPAAPNNEVDLSNSNGKPVHVWGLVEEIKDLKNYKPGLILCNSSFRFSGLVNSGLR